MEVLQYVVLGLTALVIIACRLSPAFKFTVKYALYHVYMVFIFTLALIPCCFRPGNADNVVVGRYIYHASKLVWWLFGFNIVTEGSENLRNVDAPIVFMCNHQSSLDALVIAKVRHLTFLTKSFRRNYVAKGQNFPGLP